MIYLDANASSRLRPEAEAALMGLITRGYPSNPSSVHAYGREARKLIREARQELLGFLFPNDAAFGEVVFTSGGTEACAFLLRGFSPSPSRSHLHTGHLLCSSIEHPAMREAVMSLGEEGHRVSLVAPEPDGFLLLDSVLSSIQKDTFLVSLMVANNETGALQPVTEIAKALRDSGYSGAIIADATQALGKSLFSVPEFFKAGGDALVLSGHKLGAPGGVGAAVLNSEAAICRLITPLFRGGSQEQNLRAGTENVQGIVALGKAAKALTASVQREIHEKSRLRELLWKGISERVPDVIRITPEDQSRILSNTLLVRVPETRGDDLMVSLDLRGVMVSTGAACASGKPGVSYVLKELGMSDAEAREVIRFSLDWDTQERDIVQVIETFSEAVSQMRHAFSAGVEQWT